VGLFSEDMADEVTAVDAEVGVQIGTIVDDDTEQGIEEVKIDEQPIPTILSRLPLIF